MKRMQQDRRTSDDEDDNTSVTFSSPTDESEDEDVMGDQDPGYKRRIRFTTEQQAILCEAYRQTPKPSRQEKHVLAERLNTTFKRVQVWFQNKRAKDKRERSATRPAPRQTQLPPPHRREREQQRQPPQRSSATLSASSSSSASAKSTEAPETLLFLEMYRNWLYFIA